MKKKWLSLLLALTMALSLVTPAAFAAEPSAAAEDSIVILYTNDVHTYVDNNVGEGNENNLTYSKVAGLKAGYTNALLVDAGDHIQGTAYGSLDKGETILKLMNAAGYDAATLGNHEFDYGMAGAMQAIEWAQFPYLSCNFYHEKDGVAGDSVVDSYKVFELGGKKVAIVGVTTPESFTKSTPAYFQDEAGNYIYGIAGGTDGAELYAAVQKTVDAASAEADYVIGLGHLGDDPASDPWNSEDVIANTTGLDAFIDGHSHSTVEGKEVADKAGNPVILTQTGEYLGAVGKLTIAADGSITTALLTGEDLADVAPNADVKAIEDAWVTEVNTQLGEVIGHADVTLDNYDAAGNRLVRKQETNTGDFAADALYYLFDNMDMDVDFAIMNGGGVRSKAITGDISYLTCKDIHTFGNVACLQTITGQQLLDALEWGAKDAYDAENGGFLHVSGLTYEIDTTVPSTVQKDEKGVWTGGPTGEYRVKNVQVLDNETGAYAPLDLTASYNLAGYNYTLRDLGDGFAMFDGAVNVLDYVMEDYMVLANYVKSFPVDAATGLPTIPADSQYADVNGAGRISVKYIGVEPGAWYAEAAKYVMDKGLMTSTGNGFDPSATVNRATVFQTLYNAEGKPANEKAASFTDVDGKWYADAAVWAEANGIAAVGSDALFNGDRTITRGEIAAILARYADYKKLYTASEGTAISEMADYAALPDWAVEGMTVCFNNGILSGKPGNLLAAGDTAIRAELAAMLKNFSALKTYHYDPAKPYDGVMTGLFNDVAITVGEAAGTATFYLPEGLQPWTPAVIVLTPDNTTAAAFAESETGLAWRAVADAEKIGLTFLEPAEGKTWNLALAGDGRDDAAILNQLYMTMRSKSLKNVAPFSMDKSHTTLVGYQEGGAAALLFGARYATDFSGIAAVDAPAVPADSLKTVGEQLVLPFPGDSTRGVEEMNIKAKTVDTPVWFINSDKDNQAVVDYFVAAAEAKKADANDYAETAYAAKDSDARIWVTGKEQTPEAIYTQFLGTTKRFMAMQEGGRVSFANDYATDNYNIHEEEVNGELRRWITYVPSTYTGKEEVPLVLVMHGYTASMYAIAEESRWYDVAEENGFIVAFAQGLVRPADAMGNIPAAIWAAGAFAGALPGVDPMVDVNFINALLDKTEADYEIDASRIYATGHSNGSMMTWEMGVRATERFAAIAPIGYMVAPSTDISSDALLPTWSMLGEFDSAGTVDLIEGNATVTALQAWNAHNGVNEAKPVDSKQYDGAWETMTFANAAGVPLVRFTNVLGTPHVYLQEQAATLWSDFFSKYSRGEDGKLFYQGKEVKADDYVASADWYDPAPAAEQ